MTPAEKVLSAPMMIGGRVALFTVGEEEEVKNDLSINFRSLYMRHDVVLVYRPDCKFENWGRCTYGPKISLGFATRLPAHERAQGTLLKAIEAFEMGWGTVGRGLLRSPRDEPTNLAPEFLAWASLMALHRFGG